MARILIDEKRSLWKDDQGRIICIEKKDFWIYCKSKNISLAEILRMSIPKRREFFFHWKHGLSNPETNQDIEDSLWESYGQDMNTSEDKLDPYFKERIINWRNFEKYCYIVKQAINLIEGGHPEPINREIKIVPDKHWQD